MEKIALNAHDVYHGKIIYKTSKGIYIEFADGYTGFAHSLGIVGMTVWVSVKKIFPDGHILLGIDSYVYDSVA